MRVRPNDREVPRRDLAAIEVGQRGRYAHRRVGRVAGWTWRRRRRRRRWRRRRRRGWQRRRRRWLRNGLSVDHGTVETATAHPPDASPLSAGGAFGANEGPISPESLANDMDLRPAAPQLCGRQIGAAAQLRVGQESPEVAEALRGISREQEPTPPAAPSIKEAVAVRVPRLAEAEAQRGVGRPGAAALDNSPVPGRLGRVDADQIHEVGPPRRGPQHVDPNRVAVNHVDDPRLDCLSGVRWDHRSSWGEETPECHRYHHGQPLYPTVHPVLPLSSRSMHSTVGAITI
jgi:hypothetical protein